MRTRIEVVPATATGNLARLRPLAEEILGTRNRPDGWFDRKLARERVCPELSRIAYRADQGEPDQPHTWCGYVLVGMPATPGTGARTAGVGVLPAEQGAGVGTRLLEAALVAAAAARVPHIDTPASQEARPFYEAMGYGHLRDTVTMLSYAKGPCPSPAFPPQAWTPPSVSARSHDDALDWHPHPWQRPFDPQTHELVLSEGSAFVQLSSEGAAAIVLRLLVPANGGEQAAVMALQGLRKQIAAPRPVVVPGLDPVSSITCSLGDQGWDRVQRVCWMRRTVRSAEGSPLAAAFSV
jgi:GNAT superfamily N-acetyltransferase